MTSTPTLIGLLGRKGSGKDTGAAVLIEKGYRNVKLADPLKGMLRYLLAYRGADEDTIERMIEGDLKEVPTEFLAGHTPRHAMQTLGTEWGRVCMGADFWVSMVLPNTVGQDCVITDARFQNEVDEITKAGGIVIGVSADWNEPVPGEHPSEAEIDNIINALPEGRVVHNTRIEGVDAEQSIAAFRARFNNTIFG